MRILVQKFGGTSLADGPGRAAVVGHVRAAREEGYAPVVVVSAMGRRGDPYATDTLLDLVSDTPDLPLRELDLLVSCGEVIAAVVLAGLLRSEGIPASVLTGAQAGIMTDGQQGRATVLAVRPEAGRALLEEGQVPVVTGFQGATADGEITTLGRGGSDTTAAVLGVALGCELIEIYTDVDGIKTADPSIVPEAATLRNVTYGEAVELAHLGAKVIHPRAVQVAMASRVPIRVRRNGSGSPGTLISSAVSEGPGAVLYPDRTVTGIACVRNQTYVKVEAGKTDEGLLDLFDRLGSAGISVDMIHINGERVAFTVAGDQGRQTDRILNMLELRYALETGCAKVSAVGAGMHGVPGVVSRVLRALSSAGDEVLATSDSHANISCLVREGDVQPAVSALHKEFCLAEQQREAVPFKE